MAFDTSLDRFVTRAVLWALPARVTPNHVTLFRLGLCPVAVAAYLVGVVWLAVVVFAIAALLDLVDGTLARTRGPITRLGLFLDPLADKLLIGAMLICVGWRYLVVKIVVGLIAVELVALVSAQATDRRIGLMAKSNIFGKIKMWFQSVGVGLLLLAALVTGSAGAGLGLWGSYLLWGALALGLLSAGTQAVQSPLLRGRGRVRQAADMAEKPASAGRPTQRG